MTNQQINARDWTFEVSSDGGTTFTEIAGIDSFSLDPSQDGASTDTTVFASQGIAESQAMQRGASLQLEGKQINTDDAGTHDPGQAAVETAAGKVGQDSLIQVQFAHTDDTNWTVWTAWVELGTKGGGNNDKSSWSCTFHKSGAASTTVKS